MNSPEWRLGESPHGNVHASGRALAMVSYIQGCIFCRGLGMIFENRVGGDDKLIDEFTVIASYQVFSGYHREMKLYIVKYILFQH